MEEEDKRGEALEPLGMQTNSWNHLWPGQGAKEAKGHHTKGGAASSAKFNQKNEIEHRWVKDSSLDILCGFGVKPIGKTKGFKKGKIFFLTI